LALGVWLLGIWFWANGFAHIVWTYDFRRMVWGMVLGVWLWAYGLALGVWLLGLWFWAYGFARIVWTYDFGGTALQMRAGQA